MPRTPGSGRSPRHAGTHPRRRAPSSSTSVRSDSARITSCGSRVRITMVRESSFRTLASGEISRSRRRPAAAAGRPGCHRGAARSGSGHRTTPFPYRPRSHRPPPDRCTSARAVSLVIHWLLPSAAALRPSTLVANFHVTWGTPVRCLCSHSRSGPPATSSASTPARTSTPVSASRGARPTAPGWDPRRHRPRRDARCEERIHAWRGPPVVVARFESHHRRAAPARSRAAQCEHLGMRSPGRLGAPTPATSPSRSRITAPTGGFG